MIRGLCAALALSVSAVVVIAAPASAAACDPENLNARADIDGDGSADVAVGMPWYTDGVGIVEVRGTGSAPVLFEAHTLGAGTGEGDRFGSAIAIADLDQDGCADLAIGAPAEGQSARSDGAGDNEGQVHLVFGRVGGVDATTSIMLPHASSNLDNFGNTLALVARYDQALGRGVHDLYVGAPRATVGAHWQAGEVFRYTLVPDPVARVKAILREVRSQDSVDVPGISENGDGFGAVLAATDSGGVLVGAPEEDIDSVRDAGAMWFLRVNAAGRPIASQSWSQNSPGVSGDAETEDHFGAALSSRGSIAVVGVPEEDSGSRTDSGMIQTFQRTSETRPFAVGRAITQNTSGIPGSSEADDRFGAAVAVGAGLVCLESVDVAIGVPGEDVGTRKNVGEIIQVALSDPGRCETEVLRQGSGLAGVGEAHDEVGSVLGLTRGQIDLEEMYSDRLLVGVPKEDVGAEHDAGIVQPGRGWIRSDGVAYTTLTFSKGLRSGDSYGFALASTSD